MDNPGEISGPKETYQQKLDEILSTSLTTENINTYADDALDKLTDLIDEIKNDPAHKWDFSINASTKEQEDEMFTKILGIDVNDALDGISKIGDNIKHIDKLLQNYRQEKEPRIYLPTRKLGHTAITAGSGDFSRNPLVPKTEVALFILEKEFNIDLNNQNEFQMNTGVNSSQMIRQVSYDFINLPTLHRAIASCDEIGNRTFIFNTNTFTNANISLDQIKDMSKQEIQDLLTNNPELGVDLIYSKKYPAHLTELIKDPTQALVKQIENDPDNIGQDKQYLKEIVAAPKGWVTATHFMRTHEGLVGYQRFHKIMQEKIQEKKITQKEYKDSAGRVQYFYNLNKLEEVFADHINTESVPDGWITPSEFCRQHSRVYQKTLEKRIAESNLTPKIYKDNSRGHRIREYYKEEDLEKLISDDKIPEGLITLGGFANKHDGIGREKLLKLIEANKLESREIKVRDATRAFYKIEDLERIVAPFINTEKAPEGYITVETFARDKGITREAVQRRTEEKGLVSKDYKNVSGKIVPHYKIEDLERICSDIINVGRATEDWTTLTSFVRSHGGISSSKFNKLVRASDSEPQALRKNNGHIELHYKTKDLKEILASFAEIEKAPEGWVTARSYIESHDNVTQNLFNKLLSENSVESKEYRDKIGHIRSHYKTEDLDKLVADYLNRNSQ